MAEPFLRIELPDEAATAALGAAIAATLKRGDTMALFGDLGAGKTTFARAVIRALAGNVTLEVPSPTFTLVQAYETRRLSVAHIDLYRVRGIGEIEDAGLFETGADVMLVEWPERAGGLLPRDCLEVALQMAAGGGRTAVLTGSGAWPSRLAAIAPHLAHETRRPD